MANEGVAQQGRAAARALIDQAAEAHRRVADPDEYDAVWDLLREARAFGADAQDEALVMLDSSDPSARAVACDLLRCLCELDESIGAEVSAAMVVLASRETDVDVAWSIAGALGSAADARGVPTLVQLACHPDSDVRWSAAVALPSCEQGADPVVLAGGLIQLMGDPDEDVRNWATFGLGRQTELDSPAIRDALALRLGDDCLDARDEAIVGLARRRDPRALPAVIACLEDDEVGDLVVEAAAYLADERLFAPLVSLSARWFEHTHLLDEVIVLCDPRQQARLVQGCAAFLMHVALQSADWPGLSVSLSCDRFWCGTHVRVEWGETRHSYGFEDLFFTRAGGDPSAAVEALLLDLKSA